MDNADTQIIIYLKLMIRAYYMYLDLVWNGLISSKENFRLFLQVLKRIFKPIRRIGNAICFHVMAGAYDYSDASDCY